MDYSSLLQMREEFSLLAIILVLLIYDIFSSPNSYSKYINSAAIVLMLVHTFLNFSSASSFEISGGMYLHNPIQSFVKAILNTGTILVLVSADPWLKEESSRIRRGEFYVLLLSSLLGMYFMISAGNFVLFFIGIETAAIPMATLVAFEKYKKESIEAGAKYILSSAFASGISIFGISLIYGSTGTLYFNDIATVISGQPIELLGFVFFVTGLFFKISLVPFHFWTPDVYEGAPTNITAFLSVISKGSAVYVLFVLLTKVFATMIQDWQPIIYGLTVLTITLANLFAIRQDNIKRFFAFSSVSQAGYLMLGIISASPFGLQALVYYIAVYLFSNLAIFGVIAAIEHKSGKLMISDYKGLYRTNPKLSFVMMLALFSLAGIPPFAGFFSKFFIFSAAVEQGFYVLVFIALLNTIISLYYYLIIVKAMFLTESSDAIEGFKSNWLTRSGLIISTIAIVVLGLFSFFMDYIGTL